MGFKPFIFKDAKQSLEFFESLPSSEKCISKKYCYCYECPLNHPSFINLFGITTCCHANYLALTGQLDTEKLMKLIDIHVGDNSLYISCEERRRLTKKFFDDYRFKKIMEVE